jgi:hypothetical protein
MNKEFVPYKQALALKELGFGLGNDDYIQLSSFYNSKGHFINNEVTVNRKYSSSPNHLGADTINDFEAHLVMMDNSLDNVVLAPLFQQAFRWFREKHDIYGNVCGRYMFEFSTPISNAFSKEYETHEEAELECLKKLIEIVKK